MGRPRTAPHGWIGVDLDGTLAEYAGWQGLEHIGEPVPRMVSRVKKWLAAGWEIRIVTARVGPTVVDEDTFLKSRAVIGEWCLKHIGQVLQVVSCKDFDMVELWDDRAVGVEQNTGRQLSASRIAADGKVA